MPRHKSGEWKREGEVLDALDLWAMRPEDRPTLLLRIRMARNRLLDELLCGMLQRTRNTDNARLAVESDGGEKENEKHAGH